VTDSAQESQTGITLQPQNILVGQQINADWSYIVSSQGRISIAWPPAEGQAPGLVV